MIKEKLLKMLSVNGIAFIIGIVGALASILTVFVTKWDIKIDLRWLIFILFLSLVIILFLFKLIYELRKDVKAKRTNKSTAIRYIKEDQTFLFEKKDFLGYSAMVSIFFLDDSYEVELGKGYVSNIQEEFIHVRLLEVSNDFDKNHSQVLKRIMHNDNNSIRKIIVKSYITHTIQ